MEFIRDLLEGEISGSFINWKLIDAKMFEQHTSDMPPHETLSDREFQVLQMLADGESINEIAGTCALSAKTISTHKMRLNGLARTFQ